jgi:hypothetical protein
MELLGKDDWQGFIDSPIAILMLGKTNCKACEEWTVELTNYTPPTGVRVGKILLDTPGLARFKIAQPWISEVDILPFNAIFVAGELKKQWAGSGLERLQNRLNRFV